MEQLLRHIRLVDLLTPILVAFQSVAGPAELLYVHALFLEPVQIVAAGPVLVTDDEVDVIETVKVLRHVDPFLQVAVAPFPTVPAFGPVGLGCPFSSRRREHLERSSAAGRGRAIHVGRLVKHLLDV